MYINTRELQNAVSRSSVFPRWVPWLYFIFVFYLVVPIIDVPVLGLSLSAPLFFFIALVCILRPPEPWFYKYSQYILLALAIWLGICISAIGNGIITGGIAFNTNSIVNIIRYAYWLMVFVITTYLVSHEAVFNWIGVTLGIGIAVLALLRLFEAVYFGKIGAWTRTIYFSQNAYGFLFSTFSPFLYLFAFKAVGLKRILAAGSVLILGASILVNGSRGSWVSIGTGLVLFTLYSIFSRPRNSVKHLLVLIYLAGLVVSLVTIFSVDLGTKIPSLPLQITERFQTFNNLDADKSYAFRVLMNQKAINLFEQSPLIGVGIDRFRKSSVIVELPEVLSHLDSRSLDSKSSHNSYLGFLAESGLAGAVPLAVLLVILLWQGTKTVYINLRLKPDDFFFVWLSFVQMSIHMWVVSTMGNTANWFVYGLMGAMVMLNNRDEKR